MNKLLFGPAGVPASSPGRSTVEGIPQVKKLGLGNMEMEFVQGVRMGLDTAKQVKEVAIKNDIVLTAHGPYYINLNSSEIAKTQASIKRILDTARVANACGAYSVTFHAAYYGSASPEKVYDVVRTHMKEIIKTLQNEGVGLWVRPETTGKPTQFGNVDEIIRLGQEIEQIMPCVDFSHLHARSNGKYNTCAEFSSVLEKLEKGFGKEGLSNLHVHLSGIAYGEKGEKHHLVLKESDMNYKDLMRTFKDYKVKGVIVCESPNQEVDAQLMKSEYERQ